MLTNTQSTQVKKTPRRANPTAAAIDPAPEIRIP
jgi:hypothetical protein